MTTRPPRRADETLDALTEAVDAVAPHDRAAAEEELLDADLDPRAVARRSAELRPDTGARTQTRPAPLAAGTRRWQRWAIAAALLLAVGAVLLSGRSRPERTVRVAPAPRTIEPPAGRVVPEAVEPERSDPAVGRPGRSRPTGGGRSSGASGGRRGGAYGEGGAPLAPEQAALLPLLPDAAEPLMRRGIVGFREVAVDPTLIAGLQSPAFLEASAANAGRYEIVPTCRLRPRGRGVPVSDRFGYPFPNIDPESPTAACEIVWNAEAAFAAAGGRRGHAMACGAASSYGERGDEEATQCWDAQFASLAFTGRPGGSIDNPGELRALSMLRVAELPNAGGVALLSEYPLGDDRAKHWLFVGKTRRIRGEVDAPVADDRLRLSLDDLDCFAAAPERYDWKLLGRREILAPLSGEGIALPSRADPAAVGKPTGEVLTVMRRRAWVVQGTSNPWPNERVVLYIDSELYRPYWKVVFERGSDAATFACGAGWTKAGDDVVPLTSNVIRFDARGGRIDRLTPSDEVIDPALRGEDVSLKALTAMER